MMEIPAFIVHRIKGLHGYGEPAQIWKVHCCKSESEKHANALPDWTPCFEAHFPDGSRTYIPIKEFFNYTIYHSGEVAYKIKSTSPVLKTP